jgi:hypothetical protein
LVQVESILAVLRGSGKDDLMQVDRVCVVCDKPFRVKASQLDHGKGKCCSLSCAASLASKNRDQVGAANNNWKGGSGNTERKRRYRENNPEKHAAHLAVRNAIRLGLMRRELCAECGASKTEAHHNDYTKPLSVEWLCKKHHLNRHGGRF